MKKYLLSLLYIVVILAMFLNNATLKQLALILVFLFGPIAIGFGNYHIKTKNRKGK